MPVISEISYDLNPGVTADVEPAIAASGGLRLIGYACKESAESPGAAGFNIVHGATVSGGDAVIPVALAASGSDKAWFGPEGIPMADGISIEHVAGTFDLTLFTSRLT